MTTNQEALEQRARELADFVERARAAYSGEHCSGTFRAVGKKISELQATLTDTIAAPQPSASVEQRAKEILGSEYKRTHDCNPRCNLDEATYGLALRAVMAALQSTPAAMGELPEDVEAQARELLAAELEKIGPETMNPKGMCHVAESVRNGSHRFVVIDAALQAITAALRTRSAPAWSHDLPFETVRQVVRALSHMGHSFPEGQEEQAARANELVLLLCSEVLRTRSVGVDEVNARLIHALNLALKYWADRQQRYKNRHPIWVEAAHDAIQMAGTARTVSRGESNG